jgi:RHS repeat-associated protein
MTVGSQTTTYSYDVLGNLITVTLPNGTKINYIVDAENRRVGKEVNGVLGTAFLYDGGNVAAQLNGSNAVVSQFIYASGSTAPAYIVTGGITYRIFADQLGSPRLVVNTSTGAITEQINYDEFGNVISDTNPGFQPFGFAGGLYDQDTKLVRFGLRDYNPATGRWTAKDPIRFAGGDTELYGYVLSDPVNMIDPTGLACTCKDVNNFINGFVDEYVELQSVTLGPGGLVIRKLGGVGYFGNTGQAIANLLGRGNSVDTNSTSYTAGQLTMDAVTAVANAGAGLLGGGARAGASGARAAAADADNVLAKKFIDQYFGKNAKGAGKVVEEECKRRFVKPWMK